MGGRSIWLFYNAVSIVCVIGATVVAASGREGWGWFLLAAVACSVSPGGQRNDERP